MTAPLAIAIVGYGIAGTAAAILLRRQGHLVEVFERSPRDASAGAGILLHPPALAIISAFGIRDAAVACGARVARIFGETVKGHRLMDFRYANGQRELYGLGMQRQALQDLLRGADSELESVRFGCAVERMDADRGYVWLEDGGQLGPFDLIVAADGAGSVLRRSIPEMVARDRLYRSAALVCLVDDPGGLAGDAVTQRFAGTTHVSVWPVGSRGASERRRANISVNVPLKCSSAWLESGKWRRVVCEIFPAFRPMLESLDAHECCPLTYSYRDVAMRRYATGRVVFIGDAAHSMSPQLGMGASLALKDATALAQALKSHKAATATPNEFDSLRRKAVEPYQRAGRWLTPAFQSDNILVAIMRDRFAGPVLGLPIVQARMRRLLAAA